MKTGVKSSMTQVRRKTVPRAPMIAAPDIYNSSTQNENTKWKNKMNESIAEFNMSEKFNSKSCVSPAVYACSLILLVAIFRSCANQTLSDSEHGGCVL